MPASPERQLEEKQLVRIFLSNNVESLMSSIWLLDEGGLVEQFSLGLSPFGVTTTKGKNSYLASKSAIFGQLQTPASNAQPGSRSTFSQTSLC